MATQPPDAPRAATDRQDLELVLRAALIGALAVGLMDIGVGALLSLSGTALTGVITLCYGGAALVARNAARKGALRFAALLNAYSMLGLAAGIVLTMPLTMPVSLMIAIAAPIFAVAHISRDDLRLINGGSVLTIMSILILERFVQLFPAMPEPAASALLIVSTAVIAAVVMQLFWQVHGRLIESLGALQASNAAYAAARSELEQKVVEQTADIQMALRELQRRSGEQARLLEENAGQRAMIAELSLPILPVSDDVLVMPLIGALDSARLQEAQSQALASIEERRARHLILDVTGVPVIDTQVAAGLLEIVAAARLLGTVVILVGVRPEVAQTIVGLGLDLDTIITQATLQSGLQYALRS